jgi:hypothetical protein
LLPNKRDSSTCSRLKQANVGTIVFELRDPFLPSGQRFYRAVYPAY